MQLRCLEVKKKQVWRCHSICALVKMLCTNLFCTWGQKVSATVLRTCELSYYEYVQFQPIIFSQFNQGHQWKAISQRPWEQIAGSSLPRVPENVRGTVESQLGCFRVRWLDYIILMKVHPNSLYYTASLLVKIPNITIPGFGYPNAE